MSYDLVVFEPDVPPRDRPGFIAWFTKQNAEPEHDDPTTATPALRAWLDDIQRHFPDLDGRYADTNPDDPRLTQYGLSRTMVSAMFAWSQAKSAYRETMRLAEAHRLGVYDISDAAGRVFVPGPDGKLTRIHQEPGPASAPSSDWKFTCEANADIPLPPARTFAQALNYLNPTTNSFYVLSHGQDYIQCAGARKRCTVELRTYAPDGSFRHFVFFDRAGSNEPVHIDMSDGGIDRQQKHCLHFRTAIKLFECFYKGEPWPTELGLEDITSQLL